ncbi:MAG: hypothetical protein RBS17_11100 [Coriobacteriia bacterium]|nr:hypothetical protein [Coriobacteriia bacterium]
MLPRLGIVAALVLALSIAGAGVAYAATYSLDDTPTVIVIHPDSLDALAELLGDVNVSGSVTATVTSIPASTWEASGVVPVELHDPDVSEYQATIVFGLCLALFALGVMAVRSL